MSRTELPPPVEIEPLAYNAHDAGRILGGISAAKVRQLVRDGHLRKLPHCGHLVLIARTELERFANEGVAA
jgi:hypothetical protein